MELRYRWESRSAPAFPMATPPPRWRSALRSAPGKWSAPASQKQRPSFLPAGFDDGMPIATRTSLQLPIAPPRFHRAATTLETALVAVELPALPSAEMGASN